MTQGSGEEDLEATVLSMRADVLTTLTLGRVLVQTLEALCPDGGWLDEAAQLGDQPLPPMEESRLVSAIECALVDAADSLGDLGAAA